MEYTFKTISKPSEGVYKEKGSKFLAYAFPVSNEEEVKKRLEELKERHPASRHVCYAYKIGVGNDMKYRVNDDGEPSGSAGKPIYGQILSFEITNTMVAVVRYFGGTKLGVGGLISAYKEASKIALEQSKVIEKELFKALEIEFSYDATSIVDALVKKHKLHVANQKFEIVCQYILHIPLSKWEKVYSELDSQPPIAILG